MKCEHCEFAPPIGAEGDQDECGYFEEYGTVWKDGSYGCTMNYQTLRKLDEEHMTDMCDMGTTMGIEMDFESRGWKMESVLDNMKHMIGLDGLKHKPYHRHGKQFFKPYRNYWAGKNKYLDYLSGCLGIIEKQEPEKPGGMPYYYLTEYGRHWLSMMIGVTIQPERD